jgi:phospholipid/cholesterol/gamma-HCH transport system substrate-binding protein
MQKRAPTLGNIVVIILFALSCFGLLLFLWDSFGGPLPLKPKGYRMEIAFPRVLALAEQSDVRISGVNIGHVISVKKGEEGKTIATVEINQKYAPVRRNVQAIIRQKTLLGETYIQLIPHSHTGPYVADNGRLPPGNVMPSVTLDDILATFDPKTRAAFKIWQQSVAEGINGRGEQINAAFAQLEPFSENANKLLAILVTQEGALRDLVKNTGVVFKALGSRDHQLEQLIVNGEHTFKAAASASDAWAETWRLLPPFQRHSTKALQELDKFSTVANPFLEEFRPAERSLSSLLSAAKPFAPELDRFLTALGPLTTAAKKGLPDLGKSLDLTVPVLENLRPILHNLDPFLQYTGTYVNEVQSFFSNITAASEFQQGNSNVEGGLGPKQHLLMTLATLNPESLASYGTQVGSQRANAYPLPGNYNQIGTGLPVFSTDSCGNPTPSVNGPPSEVISEALILRLINLHVANRPETFTGFAPKEKAEKEELEKAEKQPAGTNTVAAPPCRQQGPNSFNGKSSQFPHTVYEGK